MRANLVPTEMADRPDPELRAARLVSALATAAERAPSLPAWREAALDRIAGELRFDAAIFHALSPRVPLETGVVRGVDPAIVANSMAHWDRLAVDLEPLRNHALAHGGVASDAEALPQRSRARARFEAGVAKPFGIRRLAITHLGLRDRISAALILLRRSAVAFSAAELQLLRAIVAVLALADAAHTALSAVPTASLPTRLRCVDQRLTPRQREILERVALGHTNAEIARALDLSPNTLRNHLVAVYGRLGAGNRAEAVRLAVLR